MKKLENNVAKIGPFNIEVIKQENDVTIAKMPLPTILEFTKLVEFLLFFPLFFSVGSFIVILYISFGML